MIYAMTNLERLMTVYLDLLEEHRALSAAHDLLAATLVEAAPTEVTDATCQAAREVWCPLVPASEKWTSRNQDLQAALDAGQS